MTAALNHARILLRHGLFWDYHGAALPSAIYWSSLTLLDPLAALLLFTRPRLGILATIVLIVTNVVHNLVVTAQRAPEGEFLAYISHPFVILQVGFLLLVAATFRIAWKGADSGVPRSGFDR